VSGVAGTVDLVTAAGDVRVRFSGLSFRLDPTDAQAGLLARAAGARRFAFNQAVARVRVNHTQWATQRDAGVPPPDRVRPPSGIDLRAAWMADRPVWHFEVSSWVFGFAARDAAAAYQNFLTGRGRFPRFAKRGRTRERFTIAGRDAPVSAGALTLPKIGAVRIASPDPAQAKLRRLVRRGQARVTSVTVARHADGTWWAACKVERQLRAPAAPHARAGGPVVGVDRGVKTAAVVATAHGYLVAELVAGRHLRSAAKRLAHAQRTVARRTRRGQSSSKNRAKAVARVGRLHEQVAAQRAAALHTFTDRLTREHPVIVLETLTTKNLMANRRLSAAIGDQGWGELGRQLTYKTEWLGGMLLSAPRFFPSSKTCSYCGSVKTQAVPGRAHLHLRRVRPIRGPGRQRRSEPRRLGRAPARTVSVCWWLPGPGPAPSGPVRRHHHQHRTGGKASRLPRVGVRTSRSSGRPGAAR
jgi:putative transposase